MANIPNSKDIKSNINKQKLVLIDTMGIVHRAYHAYPDLKTSDGQLVNALYGFCIMFLQILKTLNPTYVIFASDLKEKTFRNEKYAEYKANRGPMDENLKIQIELIYDFIKATGLPLFTQAGYEADDIIGSIATKYSDQFDIEIVSGDKDLLQLLSEKVSVILPGKSFSDMRTYTPSAFIDRFGFDSKNYIYYKALVGDTSDNIKGAKGIGEKTATDFIQKYNTLDGIFQNIDEIKDRYKKILIEHKDLLFQNIEIVEIYKDLDINIDDEKHNAYEKSKLNNLDLQSIVNLFEKYEFNSLVNTLKKLGLQNIDSIKESIEEKVNIQFKLIKNDGFFSNVENFIYFENKFLCFNNKYEYFITDEFPKEGMGFDIKYLFHSYKDSFKYKYDDLLLLGYCMDPTLGGENVNALYKKLFHKNIEDVFAIDPKSIDALNLNKFENDEKHVKNEKSNEESDKELAKLNLFMQAVAFIECKNKITTSIGDKQLSVYKDIDIQVLPVIAQIEIKGFRVNQPYLEQLQDIFSKKIEELKIKMYESIGHEFNPNSNKELSSILFDELNLAKAKKIKTGFSTDERSISKLIGVHPIIELILEYREYNKLQSTYIIGLQKLIKNERIYTELRQTTVATGRLSSINPNLQNIPVRSTVGEQIRKAFIADDGFTLVSLDYSQIELRLMGEISGDESLIKAFKENKDIHTNTASLMFNIDEKEVSAEQRRIAKMINFGIIYGISDFGLSDRLGSQFSIKIAKDFIEKYFERYPKVKLYFEKIKEEIATNGYVETLFGRRRYFNLEVGNYMVKQSMYREAINMPIQGADADIVKMSMVKVQELIEKKYLNKAFMLLQIHDELLFEIKNDKDIVKDFANDAKSIMENVVKLEVPMVVNIKKGLNWGEMESMKI